MNPQAFNRYSYCLNNPLKYIDPSGHEVAFTDADIDIDYYILSGQYWMVQGIISRIQKLQSGWEELKQEEPEYTQHMEDSEIIFNVLNIDVMNQIITYEADMKGEVQFDEPVQLKLVEKGTTSYDVMKKLRAGGLSIYPAAIQIRTDIKRTTEEFTKLVAHESFHRYEQQGNNWAAWLGNYAIEYIIYGSHDLMPSEIRAIEYANKYYTLPVPTEVKITTNW
jgi:hypothetical protein